jgi:hypothetical protein
MVVATLEDYARQCEDFSLIRTACISNRYALASSFGSGHVRAL